jgi:hypothetical protein
LGGPPGAGAPYERWNATLIKYANRPRMQIGHGFLAIVVQVAARPHHGAYGAARARIEAVTARWSSPGAAEEDGRVDPARRGPAELARLTRRGFRLEYASMAWMTVEATVAIASGILAGSIALIGFGLDSVIEFFAAAVVVWQLRGGGEERESRAVRLIGATFFLLAAYLAAESIRDLISQARPEQPVAGLIVTAAALVVMPSLAVAKHRTGKALDNQALTADAAESAFCAFTSGAALLGVGLNAWLGWWWADPAAALVIAALAVREGLEVWEDD